LSHSSSSLYSIHLNHINKSSPFLCLNSPKFQFQRSVSDFELCLESTQTVIETKDSSTQTDCNDLQNEPQIQSQTKVPPLASGLQESPAILLSRSKLHL
jgi:hypothetical protein